MGKNRKVYYRDAREVERKIRLLKALGKDFIVESSNYTTTIKYGNSIEKYITTLMDKRAFIAHNRLKKHIDLSVLDGFKSRGDIQFFDINEDAKFNNARKSFSNIDIKAAYPTALLNHEVITKEGHDILMSLPKALRLVVLGLFASSKLQFSFKGGALYSIPQRIEKPTASLFWFAAYITDEIMRDVKQMLVENYLFYWFDGIYFNHNQHMSKSITDYLHDIGVPCHVNTYHNLMLTEKGIRYKLQYSTESGKVKKFIIPNDAMIKRTRRLIDKQLNK